MNVFLRKSFLIAFLALLFPLLGYGQDYPEDRVALTGVQGSSLEHYYFSIPINPYIIVAPTNGTASTAAVPGNPSFDHRVTYTPNPDFTGTDSLIIFASRLSGAAPELFYLILEITIEPSIVYAFDDFSYTNKNTSVQVDVLANDSINTVDGIIHIRNLPLANNCTVSYTPGSPYIDVTPDPDFVGIAHFNYVVCDDLGSCDEATVSVSVIDDQNSVPSDTLRLFTKRNKPQVVLIPEIYTLVQGPSNGTYNASSDIPVYMPDLDFDGVDYILFENGNEELVVLMTVLPFDDHVLAFDDQFYTTPYASVEFNVLENDKYGLNSSCFSIVSQPQNGSITLESWPVGTITYTPNSGFVGVDEFTYRVSSPLCDEGFETATVRVFVSDFEPAASEFFMTTPKMTPLIIGYNVPIQDFRFQIVDQGDLGQVDFYEGQQTFTIYGKEISGYNLVVYTPNQNVASGVDEFELKYCVMDDGVCVYEQSVKIEVEILDIGDGSAPMCFGDCIWPGDTNFDGVVNMQDLLPLGLKMGKIGVPRSNVNLSQWYGQYGDDWQDEIEAIALDLKHLDTDGDSIIMGVDTNAISAFYGYTHSLYSLGVPFNEYEVELTGDVFASPGDLIELEMSLGSDASPAIDVYGFVLPFNYNPDFFVSESVDISFKDNSWLTYNSPVLHMSRNHLNGLAEAGFTRTSGKAASGKGVIGKVQLIIEDDIIGFRIGDEELTVNVGGGIATAMNGLGQRFGVNIGGATIHIVFDEEQKNQPLREEQLKVYPNPTQSMLNVHLNGGQEFERVVVYNLTGQEVFDSGAVLTNHMELNMSNLTEGVYILSVLGKNGLINKKIEVIR